MRQCQRVVGRWGAPLRCIHNREKSLPEMTPPALHRPSCCTEITQICSNPAAAWQGSQLQRHSIARGENKNTISAALLAVSAPGF